MKRGDITRDSITSIEENSEFEFFEEDSVMSFIDDIESRVLSAKDLLESIRGVDDLNQVEQCLDELKELASDLY